MNRRLIASTPFGSVGVLWDRIHGDPKILRILLSRPGLSAEDQMLWSYPESQLSSCEKIDDIADAITASLEGEKVEFSLELAHMALCTEFQQRVLRAEHGIPWGSVSTYQLIARHLKKENGARAVGNALAKNPFPVIVPCHRAIRSDRSLGGYQGGLQMKRLLLESEGIRFDDTGKVDCGFFHYEA